MKEKTHAEIARTLLEESPSRWPEGIAGAKIEIHTMPDTLRKSLMDLNNAAKLHATEKSPSNVNVSYLWFSLAGASAVAMAATLLFYINFFGFAPRKDGTTVTLEFASGSVERKNQRLSIGDLLISGDEIKTGDGSVAVILTGDDAAEASLRVIGNSHIRIRSVEPDLLQTELKAGKIVASLSHSSTIQKRPFHLSVLSPNSEAEVTGTRFSDVVSKSGDTVLTTIEGSVRFRRRWPLLEDLPEELIEKSPLLSDVRRVFQNAAVQIPASSRSVVDADDFAIRIKSVPKLNQVLNLPEVSSQLGRDTIEHDELKDALSALSHFETNRSEREEVLSQVKTAFAAPPIVQKTPTQEQESLKESLENVNREERDYRFQKFISTTSPPDRDSFKKESIKILGKGPQEVILKDGRVVFATIFGENGRYLLYTAEGSFVVDPQEIEEIRFE